MTKKKRSPLETLDLDFINCMTEIGALGLKKHGDHHYQDAVYKPEGRNMTSHIEEHCLAYIAGEDHELGDKRYHLAAIAFNAMMEYYWLVRGQ